MANKGSNANEYFSVQIDAELKNDFTYFCDCCGLTVSDAVYMLAKKTIEKQDVPFEVAPVGLYLDAIGDRPKESHKSARLTIRMDRKTQEEFSEACAKIGITRSVLVRMFFMRCLNDRKMSFK